MSRTDLTALTMESPAGHTALPARLGTILVSHTLVDVYAALVPPLIGVLQVRCELTDVQKAWLLGIGSLASGLSQPLGLTARVMMSGCVQKSRTSRCSSRSTR